MSEKMESIWKNETWKWVKMPKRMEIVRCSKFTTEKKCYKERKTQRSSSIASTQFILFHNREVEVHTCQRNKVQRLTEREVTWRGIYSKKNKSQLGGYSEVPRILKFQDSYVI